MSGVLNDCDTLLQAATVRIVNPKNADIILTPTAQAFHLDAAGVADITSITVNATLVGLDGELTFTAQGATLTGVTGKSATITRANMQGLTAVVTASMQSGGVPFSRSCIIATLQDGAKGSNGAPGARGAGTYYASGSSWSDGVADAATPGANVTGDVVTISNGTTYSLTKKWDGTTWVPMGAVFDGSLFVTGSIHGSALKAGTVEIRDAQGNLILGAGLPLATQTRTNANLVPAISGWPAANLSSVSRGFSPGDSRFVNGEYFYFPSAAGYVGVQAPAHGVSQGAVVTVSFDAYTLSGTRQIYADIYGPNVDTPGLGSGNGALITMTNTRYQFTDTVSHADAPYAGLRIFSINDGGIVIIGNIKVEPGPVATAWCDSVITSGNVAKLVQPGAIGNTQIGGDIFSTNYVWNTSGWYLQRNGDIYVNNIKARGNIAGGAYSSYAWPASGANGFYLGVEGLLLGNANGGTAGYLQVSASGNIYAPGFKLEDSQLTLTNAVIVTPKIQQVALSVVLPNVTQTRANSSLVTYTTLTPAISGAVGTLRYLWSFTLKDGNVRLSSDPTATTATIQGGGVDYVNFAYVTLTLYDEGSGATASARSIINVKHGSGANV